MLHIHYTTYKKEREAWIRKNIAYVQKNTDGGTRI